MSHALPTNENAFWQFIDDCTPSMPDPHADQLAATLMSRLSTGPVANVVGFAEQLSRVLYRLDRKEYGHLSSDNFLYTRAAIVAVGRDT
ncbi:DUF4240 domain-containing protein [Streptomyces sp. NPDC003015]